MKLREVHVICDECYEERRDSHHPPASPVPEDEHGAQCCSCGGRVGKFPFYVIDGGSFPFCHCGDD